VGILVRATNMIKCKCDNCGELEYVLMDGYSFGDRLLERVMFEVRKNNNTDFQVNIDKESEDYFNTLNKKKWLKEAKDYASKNDIFTCPKCGDDVAFD
jgi:hypothetical protein